jgi:hypothetical protein
MGIPVPCDPLPDLFGDDDGRIHLIYIRPPGPFTSFDDRLTRLALRCARLIRMTIVRSWDFGAQHDWSGFVSVSAPTVLVVRGGRVIGKSVGELPALDLNHLVQAAGYLATSG